MASLMDEEDQIYLNENLQQTESSDDDEDFVNIHERVVQKMGLRFNPKQNEETNEMETNHAKTAQLTPKRTKNKKKRNSLARYEQSLKVLDQLLKSAADTVSSPMVVEKESNVSIIENEAKETNDTKANEKKRSREEMENKNETLINEQPKKRRRTTSNPFLDEFKNPFLTKRPSSIKSKILSRSHRVHSKRMTMIPSKSKAKSQSVRIKKKKSKKRKRKNDPFYIDIPQNMMSPIKRTKLQSICSQSQTKNKKKNSSYPQSKQLQQLTRSYDGIKSPSSKYRLFSTLPQSNSRKKKRKIKREIEDIQEIHVPNEDLPCCSNADSFAFGHFSQQSNDKREMDASSDENDEVTTLSRPEWLNNLTITATQSSKNNQMQNNEHSNRKKKKKENSKTFGFWQYNLHELKLKRDSRLNTIHSFKDCIHRIPANLGVTEKMTLKILKIRRLSFYDLYAAVCAYANEQNERIKVKFALLYFESYIFEKCALTQYDFITIYRPWNDMNYVAMNKERIKVGCIRVMAPISNVIKCHDAKHRVPHYAHLNLKYKVNKFKNIIFQRSAIVESFGDETDINDDDDSNDDDDESENESDEDDNDNDILMEEDELFWLQNIDKIIHCEMKKNEQDKDFEIIPNIPHLQVFERPYHVRGIIQRIFVKDDHSNIRVLVQDESGHCCMIRIERSQLRLNGIDCNKIENMMQCESMWFDFRRIELEEVNDDFDESEMSMLMQFDCNNLQSIDCLQTAQHNDNEQSQLTDFCFYGLNLHKGNLLKDGKIYYHFEHFSKVTDECLQSDILQRMKLRQFKCGKMIKSTLNDSSVCYRAPLLFELMDIRRYLQKFWRTKMCSMRLSFAVRIVCKSLLFDNVIYISDNSLFGGDDVRFVPITIMMENMSLFSAICDFEHTDNVKLYKSQPLVILRDIRLDFCNLDERSCLELRFDDYSQIERINDSEFMQSKCLKMSHSECLIDAEKFRLTPWTALSSVMISIKGIVELVSINDGFNKHCNECTKISVRNETINQNDDDFSQGVGCLHCFLKNGQIRIVLKQNDDFVVVIVPATNVWFKGSHFGQNNQGKADSLYLEQFNALKQRLKNIKIVSDCIIEYNQDKDVRCFSSLFCMF